MRWLRQRRVFRFQFLAQCGGGRQQFFLAGNGIGQQPERVIGQPVFQQTGCFVRHAGEQARAAAEQGFFGAVAVVFADAPLAQQGVEPLAHRFDAGLVQHKGQCGQQGDGREIFQRTLAFGIEKPQFVHRVAEEFQTHGARVAGRENIENVAAPGQFAAVRDHGHAGIAPFHKLFDDEIRRIVAAALQLQHMPVKEGGRHLPDQQAFKADNHAAGLPQGQAVQSRHA